MDVSVKKISRERYTNANPLMGATTSQTNP